jgi:hypothetical protein
LFVCLFSINLYAKEVNKQTAEKVAINAFVQLDNNKNTSDFQVKEILTVKSENKTSFYVVNFKPTGFIILSASDAAVPILGSSTESNFSFEYLPPQLNYLLNSYKTQIKEIEKQKIAPTKEIKQKWDKYADGSGITSNSLKSANTTLSAVSPLIQSRWGQGAGWNRFCPTNINGPNGHCLVGCTAVALAQILKYWGCQVNESGTIVDSNFNNLTVNLTESDYPWGSMGLTTSDNYNARLLYDCALTVQTIFGDSASSGNESEILPALVNNYGFKNTILEESSSSYPPDHIDWIIKLKNELNSGRPIVYAALDPSEGAHAWIIDGYDANDKFHCNWGWPEYNVDGYYFINNLNPLYFNFSMYHWAITNIEPVMSNCGVGINGGSLICSSGSFNVSSSSLPPGATITWQKSDNLTMVSPQSANPCTFQANGNGAGWVELTVHSNGSATLDRKDVWVGVPIVRNVSGPRYNQIGASAIYPAIVDGISPTTTYNWNLTPGIFNNYFNPGGMNCYTTWYRSGEYVLTLNAQNACPGTSATYYYPVTVAWGRSLSISPNPATSVATIELVNASTVDAAQNATVGLVSASTEKVEQEPEWSLEIYDSMQAMKEKKTKVTGKQTKVNTASWKDGVYIVRAKIGDEIITEKLVVKH